MRLFIVESYALPGKRLLIVAADAADVTAKLRQTYAPCIPLRATELQDAPQPTVNPAIVPSLNDFMIRTDSAHQLRTEVNRGL